jgi:hypothetical protein
MIFPAVPPSRCANSLAACSTSSSISNVVLTHLMLSHHRIKVKNYDDLAQRPLPSMSAATWRGRFAAASALKLVAVVLILEGR